MSKIRKIQYNLGLENVIIEHLISLKALCFIN